MNLGARTGTAALLLGVMMAAAPTAARGAEIPNLERGRALYENHCQVCHTQQVHTRPNRLNLTPATLREIVDVWQREENLRWGAQEIDDVVYFLTTTLYKSQ